MYLKSDRDLYRRRRRIPWLRLLSLLALIGAGVYVVNTILGSMQNSPVRAPNTPTPVPTATPSPAIYVAQAEDAYWAGDMEAAVTAYQRALDLEPNQFDVYLELSRLLTFQTQPERGLEMAREALRRQPENARAWALLGMAYDWLGLVPDAIEACEKAVSLDPTLPEAYAYLAEAYVDTGNWYAANAAIATAMELDPHNVDVLRNRGYVLEGQGNYYGAIEAYREALKVHNMVYLHMAIGRNANALGNWTLAVQAYTDAVKADPNHVPALARLGLVLLLTGDYDKAKINLNKAIQLDPTFGEAYAAMGTLYFQQRNYEDAIEMLKPAIRYGEARARRRTVSLIMTLEDTNAIGTEPAGAEVARAVFVHPGALETPLRGALEGEFGGSQVRGMVRFDVLSGRYTLEAQGLPPAPPGKVYIGWFKPLQWPERQPVRTDAIFPAPDGRVQFSGDVGRVKGPAIETYYTLALSYYLLDQCNEAIPYIEAALRLDPEDANALQTLRLCKQ
ncbi:MAG TPA: tetratricopeptide repeat protein [Anaerolineae bacterium]|nr:tetratricopeptide repeat protein [Anaerolineae bacterium]HQK13030.1 tetratricopeptide repeat protein [Anaerolineae bacterium]